MCVSMETALHERVDNVYMVDVVIFAGGDREQGAEYSDLESDGTVIFYAFPLQISPHIKAGLVSSYRSLIVGLVGVCPCQWEYICVGRY